MKRLDIIIPREQLGKVNDTLHKNRVGGMTFYEIKGRGRSKYEPESIGTGVMEYVPEFGRWTKIEVLVADLQAKQITDDILQTMSTGSASDGKIFVYDVVEAFDIGTRRTGDTALQ